MKRPIPKNPEFQYRSTIVATGGRLEDLESILKQREFAIITPGGEEEDPNYAHHISTNHRLYFAVKTPNSVEFDLYERMQSRSRTDSADFRKNFGIMLTVLLQTGYTIRAEKLEQVSPVRVDF